MFFSLLDGEGAVFAAIAEPFFDLGLVDDFFENIVQIGRLGKGHDCVYGEFLQVGHGSCFRLVYLLQNNTPATENQDVPVTNAPETTQAIF